ATRRCRRHALRTVRTTAARASASHAQPTQRRGMVVEAAARAVAVTRGGVGVAGRTARSAGSAVPAGGGGGGGGRRARARPGGGGGRGRGGEGRRARRPG